MARLKLQRVGGKAKVLLVKPPSFEGLLELCSAKLSLPSDPFVARRLFTADGFEVDADAYEEIVDGDVLVATGGEEVAEGAMGGESPYEMLSSEQSSRTSSSTSQPSLHRPAPLAQLGRLPSPGQGGMARSAAAAVSSAPTAAPLAAPSSAHTHLTVLQSAPLISRDPTDPTRVTPLQQLDLEKEREEASGYAAHPHACAV